MVRGTGASRRVAVLLVVVLISVVAAACGSSSGSSSGNAQTLLKQTFSGSHTVKSGVLSFALTVTPSGSSTIKGPISLSLSGPFQSRGSGRLPESNLNISIQALGHTGQLGIVSTGSNGYITLDGAAYQLPAADYQKLASSFSSAGSGTGGLSKLGINPLHWLTNPSVVGNETVAGASTTHIKANINVASLLGDLNTFLGKASASGAAGSTAIPSTISASTRQKIAAAVKNPTVDVWTGTIDKTLRKLAINLNVPVSGQVSTLLGGLSSAGIGMTLQYANLNQPQTVAAPSNVQPFSAFAPKLEGILHGIQSSLGAGALGSAGSSSSSSSGSGSASSSNVNKYTQCIQRASGNVTKMQKCASLLSASGG